METTQRAMTKPSVATIHIIKFVRYEQLDYK